MRAAEFILDGSTGGTITEAVGLRIANNLQANKATTSYGLQIYRDSFDYTYDIALSLGGHITGDSYINQDLRAAASPTFGGVVIAGDGTIGQAAGPLLTFDDNNNYLEITGCSVGIGTTAPANSLHVYNDDAQVIGTQGILIEQDSTGDATLRFLLTGERSWRIGIDNSTADNEFRIANDYATDDNLLRNIFSLDHAGNLGLNNALYAEGGKITQNSRIGSNTIVDIYDMNLTMSTGAGGAGLGLRWVMALENAANDLHEAGSIQLAWVDATEGNEDSTLTLQTYVAGTVDNSLVIATGNATFAGTISATNYTAANLLTACATSAGGLDFSGVYTLTVAETATTTSYHTDARAATWLAANHETTYNHTNYNTAYSHSQESSGNPHSVTPTELSLVIGTNTQAWDAQLDDLATITATAAEIDSHLGGHSDTVLWSEVDKTTSSIADITTKNHTDLTAGDGSDHTYIDQAVTIAATPTFGGIIIADGGTIGQAAGPLIAFDDTNNFLEITGCSVGIGTVSPNTPLTIMSTGNQQIQLLDSSDLTTEGVYIGYDRAGNTIGYIGSMYNSDANRFDIRMKGTAVTDAKLTVLGSGKVGIGTTAPIRNLVIAASDSYPSVSIDLYSDTPAQEQYLVFQKSHSSTIGTLVETIDTDRLGTITWYGVDNGNNSDAGAEIVAVQNGAAGTRVPTDIIMATYSPSAKNTNQFVLHHDGGIAVGLAAPTAKLHIDQTSASGAMPVLKLDQGDVDDSFIDFVGTSAVDGTRSISSSTGELGACFGKFRVEINGVTKWVRIYDDES